MSRSHRKTPIVGITTAASEKEDKRLANRKLRRYVCQLLAKELHRETWPQIREVSSVWTMAKDGKQYLTVRPPPEWMRK